MSEWYYNDAIFTEEMVGDYFGFVYEIQNKITSQKYIGVKFFTKAARKQVKGKKRKIRKPSGWKNYWGSGERILEAVETYGEENFTKTILHLCKTRGECKYTETKVLFANDVLKAKLPAGADAFYNDNIMMKFTRRNIG